MQVETKWFGTVEIGEDKVITFDKGIIGFDDYKKYVIVYESDEEKDNKIMWLQSLDDVSLALPIIQPEIIVEDYAPEIADELVSNLIGDINSADYLMVVTLTVPSDLTKMSCNLKAPIIVNNKTMKAAQLIADNSEYEVKYPIYELLKDRQQ